MLFYNPIWSWLTILCSLYVIAVFLYRYYKHLRIEYLIIYGRDRHFVLKKHCLNLCSYVHDWYGLSVPLSYELLTHIFRKYFVLINQWIFLFVPFQLYKLSSKYYLGLATYLISNASCVIILKSKAFYKIDYLWSPRIYQIQVITVETWIF